jgi:hypothetical protein
VPSQLGPSRYGRRARPTGGSTTRSPRPARATRRARGLLRRDRAARRSAARGAALDRWRGRRRRWRAGVAAAAAAGTRTAAAAAADAAALGGALRAGAEPSPAPLRRALRAVRPGDRGVAHECARWCGRRGDARAGGRARRAVR